MINIKNTENNLGITITGDYNDLDKLHTALSSLVGYEGEIKSYDAVSLRILGVCYDLRHAYMGDREIEITENGMSDGIKRWHGEMYPDYNVYYSVNILWIEAMFSILAIEDLINIHTDKKLSKKMINKDEDLWFGDEENKEEILKEMKIEKELSLPYNISIVRMYGEAVWKALGEFIGINRYRRIKKSLTDDYMHYLKLKYNGYCTQYLDILNEKYIYANPEKRATLLASAIRKLIKPDDEYYDMERSIKQFAVENNISYESVRLANVDYPEELEW